jgi:glutathione synthase/RimK-type ligase-like ATP-grasp enzyme
VKKVGVFSVREQFAYDVLQRINNLRKSEVKAEFALIGETRFNDKSPYRVIIDRVTSYVDYFEEYFRNAALTGTYVMNNPFGKVSTDRFQNYYEAKNLGLSVPRTVCLPTREYHPDCSSQDLGNLKYPLDWEDIADFIGFPAVLKPYAGHGFRDIYKINNLDELIKCYNSTGRQTMIMQEYIPYDYVVKTFIVGAKETCHIKHLRTENQFVNVKKSELNARHKKVMEGAIRIAADRGLDFVTTEFAVKNDVPYVYNFLNPFPDCREEALTPECYKWCVDKLAELAVEYALSDRQNYCETMVTCEKIPIHEM